jgi:hypothetical protein
MILTMERNKVFACVASAATILASVSQPETNNDCEPSMTAIALMREDDAVEPDEEEEGKEEGAKVNSEESPVVPLAVLSKVAVCCDCWRC